MIRIVDPEVAVLIPCYNESQTIAKVVKAMKNVLPDAIIYVYDNNSSDGTDIIAKDSGAVVRYEPRQGKGNVIQSMFRDIEADVYILIDGDDTYPVEDAPKLVESVCNGADMVIGDRLSSTYFTENKRAFHNSGNRIVRFMINGLFKADIRDIMTGYRACSRSFVKNFPVLSKGFEIETEMTIHALDKNYHIVEIPVAYRDRPEGSESKLNTFSDGFKVILTILTLLRDYKPLLFFSILSFIAFSLGLAIMFPVLLEYVETGLVPRFPTLLGSGFILLVAIILFFVGVVLDAIVKKHRQLYELLKKI